MATRIQIIAPPQIIEGKSKITGNDYKMAICQAVVFNDGHPPEVAELILPRDHVLVGPGMYDAEFGPFVDRQTKRLGGQLQKLTAVPGK